MLFGVLIPVKFLNRKCNTHSIFKFSAELFHAVTGSSYTNEAVSVIRCETFGQDSCKDGKDCIENCEGSPTPYCFASWTNGNKTLKQVFAMFEIKNLLL